MSKRSRYVPTKHDGPKTWSSWALLAYRCGLELAPGDMRAVWIDEADDPELIEVYHQGQAEQYESEDW
jgi:hypothetical protein